MTKNKSKQKNIPAVMAVAGVAELVRLAKAVIAGKNQGAAKKQKKKKSSSLVVPGQQSLKSVRAPVSVGTQMRAAVQHSKFVIKGRCLAAQLGTSAGTLPVWVTLGGTPIALNIFDVDILGTGSSPFNFQNFPSSITNIAGQFQRYRIVKLKACYVPTSPTTSPQQIIIASSAEVLHSASTAVSLSEIAAVENQVSTSCWAPIEFDLTSNGGLRKEWLYADVSPSSIESQVRQESAGSVFFHYLGAGVANAIFGSMFYDYEIEFDGLGGVLALQAPEPHPSSSSCSDQFLMVQDDASSSSQPHAVAPLTPCVPSSSITQAGLSGGRR